MLSRCGATRLASTKSRKLEVGSLIMNLSISHFLIVTHNRITSVISEYLLSDLMPTVLWLPKYARRYGYCSLINSSSQYSTPLVFLQPICKIRNAASCSE